MSNSMIGRGWLILTLLCLAAFPAGSAFAQGSSRAAALSLAPAFVQSPAGVPIGASASIGCTDTALNTALASGGTITFSCGPNPVTIFISLKTLTNTTATIDGGGLVTLNGNSNHQLFVITGTTHLTLKNITLSLGSNAGGAGHNGGAIENHAVLEIDNSQLRSNSAGDSGGAVYNSGVMTITSSTVDTNTAYSGAGVYNSHGTLSVVDTTLSNNAAVSGAGLTNDRGELTLTGVSFLTNTASSYGGGLYNNVGAFTATNASFTNNTGLFAAGGLYNLDWSVATLTNATFTRNHAQYGGAIESSLSSATPPPFMVIGSTFSDNTASAKGGAIHNVGPLAIESSIFISNSAGTDGGGLNNFVASAWITSSSFISNSASYGGGIENGASVLSLVDTRLRANRAYTTTSGGQGNGGGLDNSGNSRATLANVTVSGNYAFLGGGLENDTSQIALTNSTLSGNSAVAYAGGFENFDGSASLSFVTLDGNSSPLGAGVYQVGVAANQAVTLTDTIVAHGAAGVNCLVPSGTVSITSSNYNLSDDTSCNAYFTQPNDQKNVNPLLGLLADNGGPTLTHLPAAGSPGVDQGGAVCPATDQRGVTRPQNGVCDIGAVERRAVEGGPSHWLYLPLVTK